MSIELGEMLTAMAQLVVIGGGLVAIYFGIKRWVGDISKDTKETAKQLETSNGTTVAGYVEDLAGQVSELLASHADLRDTARDNRTRIEVLEAWRNEHTRGHP